ncbi:lipopolysaccharide export system protein LptC [Devosia sp. UYZn731]|uniref:hypothetical protein n=1 Tax=Devosia sp. UYZn731 TaxID=3156345 RepID=UPI00339A9699
MNTHADTGPRLRTYQRLVLRNRVVGVLRIAVPLLGVVVLVLLVGQIYLSSLGSRFGVGQISVTRDRVTIDAPQYSGVLDDGSVYRVSATRAAAALNATDVMDLSTASINVVRTDGVTMDLSANMARLDTTRELVIIEGDTHVVESTGTTSTFANSVFDWQKQELTGKGPVVVDYADGTHLVAKGLRYNAKTAVWTFTAATVTLPDTPGAKAP